MSNSVESQSMNPEMIAEIISKCPHCGEKLKGTSLSIVQDGMDEKETYDFQVECPSCKNTIHKKDIKNLLSSSSIQNSPSTSETIHIIAILVLGQRQLSDEKNLLEQITAVQRSHGYIQLPKIQVLIKVAGDSLGDIAYTYAIMRENFTNLGGNDFIDRTLEFNFQSSDGNHGKDLYKNNIRLSPII